MDCLFIKIEKFLKKLQIPKNEAHVSTQIVCSARFLQKSPLLGRRRWLSAAIQANHRWFRCSPRASSFPPSAHLVFLGSFDGCSVPFQPSMRVELTKLQK